MSSEMMKLFKVILQGYGRYGTSYVMAKDPTSAYKKVKDYLDDNDLGFPKDRELESIELIADSDYYGNIATKIYL